MTQPWKERREIGDAVLYLGDCLEILPTLAKADHVICDPPYDAKTHAGARYGFVETSSEIPFPPIDPAAVAPILLSACEAWCIAFCALEMYGDYKRAAGDQWVRAGFWRRTNGVPQFTGDRPGQPGEGIAIMHAGGRRKAWNGSGRHGFWQFPIVSGGEHPTTKPEPLMAALLADFTARGETIADPFMGSGTTGVACMNLGRKFIGIEIEPRYYEIACRRIEDAQRQSRLFA